MNRLLKWLGNRLFPQKPAQKSTLQQTVKRGNASRVRTPTAVRPAKPRDGTVDYNPDVVGHIEDGGPGKNVLVRSKYIREETGTHDKLTIVDESLTRDDDEGGLDPYNTGRFDRSKTWKLRSGK